MDPDEIWIGVVRVKDPVDETQEELFVDRRYIRTDGETGIMAVLQFGRKFWNAITVYPQVRKGGAPDPRRLDTRRGGKLLWKRK